MWNLQYATLTDKAATTSHTIPGLAESWEASNDGLTYTYTLRDGLKWSDGDTAHRRGHRVDDQPRDRGGGSTTTRPSEPRRDGDRRPDRPDRELGPRSEAADDGRLHPSQARIEKLDAKAITKWNGATDVGSGPFTLQEGKSGQSWTMVQPQLLGRGQTASDRPGRVPRLHQRGRDGRGAREGEIDAAQRLPASRSKLQNDDIVAVEGEQGGFTEISVNG